MKTLPTLNEGIEVVEGFAEDFEVNELLGEMLEKEAEGDSLCPEEQHLRDLVSDPESKVREHTFDVVNSKVLQRINLDNNNQPEIISSNLISKVKFIDSKAEIKLKYKFNVVNNCINTTPHCYVDNNKLIVLNEFNPFRRGRPFERLYFVFIWARLSLSKGSNLEFFTEALYFRSKTFEKVLILCPPDKYERLSYI